MCGFNEMKEVCHLVIRMTHGLACCGVPMAAMIMMGPKRLLLFNLWDPLVD